MSICCDCKLVFDHITRDTPIMDIADSKIVVVMIVERPLLFFPEDPLNTVCLYT